MVVPRYKGIKSIPKITSWFLEHDHTITNKLWENTEARNELNNWLTHLFHNPQQNEISETMNVLFHEFTYFSLPQLEELSQKDILNTEELEAYNNLLISAIFQQAQLRISGWIYQQQFKKEFTPFGNPFLILGYFDGFIDYYHVLGLPSSCTAEDIRKAYRAKAKILHPDIGGDEEAFKQLKEAYDVLSDDQQRANYNQKYELYQNRYDYDIKSTSMDYQYTTKNERRRLVIGLRWKAFATVISCFVLIGMISSFLNNPNHKTVSTNATNITQASSSTAKNKVPSQPTLEIANVNVTKNDGQNLEVTLTADNKTNKAFYIHSSDFALSSDATTLSPSSESNVPAQVPADSQTRIKLEFYVKGQLSGTINPKLGFQPSGNQPEQFQSLESVEIPVPKPEEVSKPVSPPESTTSKPYTNNVTVNVPSSSSHNYQSDFEQDVAVIKSKATISPDGVQWEPIVNANPDAEVPDGFGGMLYAWNVILNGNGDGNAQQIYFFDNNRYIGRDTANNHRSSSVHAGSTGAIIVTYEHYLANDAMCCPSGQPFTVTFHWNGSRLTPDSVATLNEAVNNQFK